MRGFIKKKMILAVCLAAMLIGMMGVGSQAASLPFTYTQTVRVEYKKGLQNRVRLWLELKSKYKKYETPQFNDNCKKTFWAMTSTKSSVASKPTKAIFDKLGTGTKYGPLVQLKKPGSTTVKYKVKVNNKTYTCKTKIYVYDYSNPIKSLKLDGNSAERTNFGMNANDVYYLGEYGSKKSHKVDVTPAKDWSVTKIVAKNYNASKTTELQNGKAFSKKYDELIITMKNSKTKVEKKIDIMSY